jgi:Mrp family chromosome partitioning ATPase
MPWVHELAATLAQSGSQVLALEADLEQWPSAEQAWVGNSERRISFSICSG